jgi:GNAT superfamily N-acetyltransferase
MTPLIEAIEASAFAAWPAETVQAIDGWRMRFMHGVSRRANSVWPGEATGPRSLEARIDEAERWYEDRGLRAAFQLTPLARPGGLDEALARRGYAAEVPVSIQTANAGDVAVAAPAGSPSVRAGSERTEDWFEIAARRSRFAATADVYRGLLDRIGAAARYAVAYVDGQPVGAGLGVVGTALGEGCMGVFSMLTLPAGRRRGAARAVLSGLARCAAQERAERMYLQVERDNAGALALYAAASFREVYGYHYRVRRP